MPKCNGCLSCAMRRTLALLYIGVLISCASSQKQDRSMFDDLSEADDRLERRSVKCKKWTCNIPHDSCCDGQVCSCKSLWTGCICKDADSSCAIIAMHNYICILICLLAFLLHVVWTFYM
ncbi:uncharacterized protein LOC128250512 [Octopus bimaculoides]|uniref:uncharacterized protein LOC128250512 n=1 Tax=Octopus bimaculoides TaxID=37653 RepID=UPI0022E2B5C2|nr:uncharacterized protein LOC128250512 [Octopus bimaculoides]